ncbi:MAG: hypothetical protein IPK74_15860 [Deltaproteobacteria bacterium]|nr:hypothetical protein [Deltaproteobacteria bacterium]
MQPRTRARWPRILGAVKCLLAIATLGVACHPAVPRLEQREPLAQHAAAHTGTPGDDAVVLEPLPDADRRRLFGSPADDVPAELGGVTQDAKGRHYLTSNEHALHAFEPTVRGRGGGYLGVGSDQAYLLMGWARSSFGWLVDYDPEVVQLHGIYRALLLEAEDPEAFLALWSREGRHDAHAAIDTHAPSGDRVELRALYRRQRAAVAARLAETVQHTRDAGVPCWLTDVAQFDHVRALVRGGRTRAMLVDLAGERGLAGISEAATATGMSIEVLYLSNAEEYWRLYPKNFRRNLAGLPMADGAAVLRTLLIWHVNRDYRYVVQRADNLRAWLAQRWVGNVYHLSYQRPEPEPEGLNLFEITAWPDDAPSALRAAASRKIRELAALGYGR